jgi:serine/threonine protein phosphatase 1
MFKRLWARRGGTAPPFETPIEPDQPFVAIGDIHGCLTQLEALLPLLEGHGPQVFLGDYVDRGPQSAQVLTRLLALQSEHPADVICLMGNHEVMMLDFIDDPLGGGARWLRFGGVETLASFGISMVDPSADFLEVAEQLEHAMPEGMLQWLRDLPLQWSSGNMHCVHASMNPAKPPNGQSENALLWGHPDFFSTPRDDGQYVIHGHTIVDEGAVCEGRISVDTGAYRGGALTAVQISAGSAKFITV